MIRTYSPILQENLVPVIERIDLGFASCIIIFGGLGQGKTTLGVHIGDEVNRYYGQPLLDLESREQVATGAAEFKQKLIRCYRKKLHVVLYDESGDFSSRGHYQKLNKELYRLFQVYRALKVLVVLILPSFTDLDTGLFKLDVVRMGLRCRDRDERRGVFYGYSLKKLIYAKHNITKGRVVPAFAMRSVSPNFTGIFRNLEPERAAQLDRLSTREKVRIAREVTDEKKPKALEIDESIYRWSK